LNSWWCVARDVFQAREGKFVVFFDINVAKYGGLTTFGAGEL
jgi:hypothetical protein